MILIACCMMASTLCDVGMYSELMMSAWISTSGGLYKKWSEISASGPLNLVGSVGVLKADGEIANGCPSRIKVPQSWIKTILHNLILN